MKASTTMTILTRLNIFCLHILGCLVMTSYKIFYRSIEIGKRDIASCKSCVIGKNSL